MKICESRLMVSQPVCFLWLSRKGTDDIICKYVLFNCGVRNFVYWRSEVTCTYYWQVKRDCSIMEWCCFVVKGLTLNSSIQRDTSLVILCCPFLTQA